MGIDLECYNLFSGVKLSIRSFCFIAPLVRQLNFAVNVASWPRMSLYDMNI